MTLREFLNLELLSGNLAIILEKNKPCDGKCDKCACELHPTLNIVKNYKIITEDLIMKKGGTSLLDNKIKRIYPLKGYKTCIELKKES